MSVKRRAALRTVVALLLLGGSNAFLPFPSPTQNRLVKIDPRETGSRLHSSSLKEETREATVTDAEGGVADSTVPNDEESEVSIMSDIVGKVDNDRIVFPELSSGEVSRMFSSLEYVKTEDGSLTARHAAGSTFGAAALVAGTTVGAGVLALPTATAPAGFLPSTAAMCVAWLFMTMSGLLISELSLNRFGETGRPGVGLLEMYESSLGKTWGAVGSVAYFFLHYAMMVAYIAQGGANFQGIFNQLGLETASQIPGFGQVVFAGLAGAALYTASQGLVEKVNNAFVIGVFGSFIGIVALGAGTADFAALVDPANQHPNEVVNAFPILFLALVYQNIVPTVVAQLEGDRKKITTAITAGTTMPLLMFLAWNAVILGNVMGMDPSSAGTVNPVALLQNGGESGGILSTLVGTFSELALITSLIGFVYGLIDAWTDIAGIPVEGPTFEKWKPALFASVILPPLALSVGNPDIFYSALDYGGAFGVSTLFLVLPPIMTWKERYGQEAKPLTAKPMVPFGKVALSGMLTVAGALIVEQGAEKLGVVDFFRENGLS